MAKVIIGGKNYRWRGKAFKVITQNEFACASLSRKDSMIMVSANVNGESQYKITITASRNTGNGALLVNFFGGKNYDGPHIPINIASKQMQEHTVTVPTPKFPSNLPIYLRVWRPNDAKGNVIIRSIQCVKIGDYTQSKFKSGKIKSQKKKKQYSNKEIENLCKKIKSLNKKVILYCVTRVDQLRVLRHIKINPNDGFCHVALIPLFKEKDSGQFAYPEDYDISFTENIIFGDLIEDFQLAVNCLKPVAFVCGTLPNHPFIKIPSDCKKIFISHGLIGKHALDMEEIKKHSNGWIGCDLYCGAGKYFESFVNYMTNGKQNVSNNIIPQLDTLYYNLDYADKFTNFIKKQKSFEKYILFAGFGGSNRSDFKKHNADYYRTATYLNELAIKNNWFVFIKPRLRPHKDIKFINKNDTVKEFVNEYEKLYNSHNICMIHKFESIYKYFFCDAIILNGTSTVEIEACCANKPLIIVRTEDEYDPLDTLKHNAAIHVKTNDKESLENALKKAFLYPTELTDNQKQLLNFHNISFDGKMGARAYKEIIKILK